MSPDDSSTTIGSDPPPRTHWKRCDPNAERFHTPASLFMREAWRLSGISQEELGCRLGGRSQQAVAMYLSGRARLPLDLIDDFADATKLDGAARDRFVSLVLQDHVPPLVAERIESLERKAARARAPSDASVARQQRDQAGAIAALVDLARRAREFFYLQTVPAHALASEREKLGRDLERAIARHATPAVPAPADETT